MEEWKKLYPLGGDNFGEKSYLEQLIFIKQLNLLPGFSKEKEPIGCVYIQLSHETIQWSRAIA